MITSGVGKRQGRNDDGVWVIGHLFWKMFSIQYHDEENDELYN